MMPEKPTYEELEQRVRELEDAESERINAQEALAEEATRKNLLIDQSSSLSDLPPIR